MTKKIRLELQHEHRGPFGTRHATGTLELRVRAVLAMGWWGLPYWSCILSMSKHRPCYNCRWRYSNRKIEILGLAF